MPPFPKVFYGLGSFWFTTSAVGTNGETSGHVRFTGRVPLHITSITLAVFPQLSAAPAQASNGYRIAQRTLLIDSALIDPLAINDPIYGGSGGPSLDDYKAYWQATPATPGTHHYYFGERGLVIPAPATLLMTPAYDLAVALVQGQFISPCRFMVSINGFEETEAGDAAKYKLR
jgi:hypothetical protein